MSLEEEKQRLCEQLAEREEHIAQLESQLCQQSVLIQQMQEQIVALNQQVKGLQDRLAKDSHNSSFPPIALDESAKACAKKARRKAGDRRDIREAPCASLRSLMK